jgi:hypothetical protein
VYRTATAAAGIAAPLRSDQVEVVAQHPEQGFIGTHRKFMDVPVDFELD